MAEKIFARRSRRVFRRAAKAVAAVGFVLALGMSSFTQVTANTVTASVVDRDNSYSFCIDSAEIEDIIGQAQELGLEPLGELDVAERVENTTTVNIRRGVRLKVREAGAAKEFIGFKGDTVEKALLDNNVVLKPEDGVSPERDHVITGETEIEIRRSCSVTVLVDGVKTELKLTGGTVGEALKAAGVELSEDDSINYPPDEPLFERMNIRVVHSMQFTVTADGETREFNLSALTVGKALELGGYELSEEDRVEPSVDKKLESEMNIVITRITSEETTETEEVPYETVYEESAELFESEEQVVQEGMNGEKTVIYKYVYANGEEESKEAVSEEVTLEPVAARIITGTKKQEETEYVQPDYSDTGMGENISTDYNGNTFAYSSVISGNCTAYYGGYMTSIGLTPARGIVAVDPRVIPYGTKLYIASPDGSVIYGYAVAGDTGGACMAGDIVADLYYDTYEECTQIGRRVMNVYILS